MLSLAATNITENGAVLSASFNRKSTKRVAAWFTWGVTTNLPNRTPTQSFPGDTNVVSLSHPVSGLATNRIYYYRVFASNEFGIRPSGIYAFVTKHDVRFHDLSASNITSDGALLTTTYTAKHSGLTWFRYGFSSNVGYSTPVTTFTAANSNLLAHSHQLTNLTPNRTYYYRLMASNQFGVSGSSFSNFTTKLNFAVGPLEVTLHPNQSATLAVLNGTITPAWGVFASFEWGTSTNNPSSQPQGEGQWTPSTILFQLQPNTLYYCRLVATNQYGSDSTPWRTFRTPTGLIVSTYPAGSGNTYPPGPGYPWGIGAIGSTRARLGGRIDNVLPLSTDAWFEWGTTTNYGNRTPIAASGFGGFEAFAELNGLQEAGAIYHYRVVASNSVGMKFGGDVTFATPLFPLSSISSNLPAVINGKALSGDFNNDGLLDILVAGETSTGVVCEIWRNDLYSFRKMSANIPGTTMASLAAGDEDNDGRLDVLVGALERFEIWRNHGSGLSNINVALPGLHVNQGHSLDWGDYNNDGLLDIVVEDWLNLFGTNQGVGIWTKTSEGFQFQTLQQLLKYACVRWADYDNDGWLDIAVNGFVFVDHTPLWRNGRSGFDRVALSINLGHPGSITWGDYNNDGNLDQLRAGVLWQNAAGTFSNANVGLPPVGDEWTGATTAWGDYDNDGRLDILLYGRNLDGLPRMDQEFICQIWRNTGNGFTNINAGLPGLFDGSAAWGDYDNDGRLDVLLTGRYSRSNQRVTEIYRNVHVPPNSPPTAPTGLQVFLTEFGVAFAWLAASDAQTPSSGLSYNLRVGSAPGQCDLVSPNALPDGKRLLLQLGNAQMRRFAYLTGLTNGQTVYWTVQAIDTAFAGGPFAPEQTFVYPPTLASLPPTLSAAQAGSAGTVRLGFVSSIPLPFTIFTSSNLVDWQRLSTPNETSPGTYELLVPATGSVRFYHLRSP